MEQTVCGRCQVYLKPRHNGIVVENVTADHKSISLIKADLMECPECGQHIIARFGAGPYVYAGQVDYAEKLKAAHDGIIIQVKECELPLVNIEFSVP